MDIWSNTQRFLAMTPIKVKKQNPVIQIEEEITPPDLNGNFLKPNSKKGKGGTIIKRKTQQV